jgi:hypothetical protein
MTDDPTNNPTRMWLVTMCVAAVGLGLSLAMTLFAQSAREDALAHRGVSTWGVAFDDKLVPSLWILTVVISVAALAAIIGYWRARRQFQRITSEPGIYRYGR